MTTRTPIDDYIDQQAERFQSTLHQLRSIIRAIAPKANEVISYQVACFKDSYMVVGIGVTKTHCSLYTMSSGLVKSIKTALNTQGIKVSGTTLHFNPDDVLPVKLIEEIVKMRLEENEARMKMKKTSSKTK